MNLPMFRVSRKRLRCAIRSGTSLTFCLLALCGCASTLPASPGATPKAKATARPYRPFGQEEGRKIEPGILRYEVSLPTGDGMTKTWMYLPERPAEKKLPCVIIAPAGTRMFHGMVLGDGDVPEHLPYVRAGFAVVAYEIAGNLGENASEEEILAAAKAFKKADAGLANARAALDAIEKLPYIDSKRIYTAGHSSAATLSLLVAEHDPRIKACIAYAPVCNVPKQLGDRLVSAFSELMPGYRAFIERSSPHTGTATLRCPVFLFHADDDSNVPTAEVADFAAELKKTNRHVTFVRVAEGNHYESMIKEGIPKAIEWLKGLPVKDQTE